MTKKKTFLSFILALILMIPCMFFMTACGNGNSEPCTHTYGAPTYNWSQDNSTCTAERVCTKDATHKESETVSVSNSVTTVQSCVNDEITTYTASFTKDGFATKTKSEKTKDKLGHDFNNGAFVSDNTDHWKKCSRCDAEDTEHKVAHNCDLNIQDNQYFNAEATCEHGKLYFKSCECGKCGTVTFDNGVLIAHSFTRNEVSPKYLVSDADCENPAVYYKSCELCGLANDTLTFVSGNALGHQFSNTWTFDETGHWKAATCEHSTEKSSFAAHTLNEDGVCDCGYNENEYLFQLFKNIKYLPDYTEDYTYTEIYEKIDSSTDDVNESTQTENKKDVISYDHDTNSAYASYYRWIGDAIDNYSIEYVEHDGGNYFYYREGKENVESFSLGDESCAKGICNSKIRYSYFSSDMDFYTDYETFALLLQDVENGNIGDPSTIDMVDNKNGTFSLVEEYDFGTKTFTITFNREKILSMVDEYEYLEDEGDVTYSGSEITTITITYSYDSKTIDDEEIVFPDASELNFLVVDVCIYVNAINEYIRTGNYNIGTAFSLDQIQGESLKVLEVRNLEIVGLYYDFEHTQPVDIANYKYGYWAVLYAEVRPIDGYAEFDFEVEYYDDDYGFHRTKYDCLTYNIDTNETITLPIGYTEMIVEGVSLDSDVPRHQANYKIFLNDVEITSENNTITLENQRVYKIKVEMLPSEE